MSASRSITTLLSALAVLGSTPALAANPLPAYNVDPNTVSVSGLSSGGFMSAQIGVAYSGTFKAGFGVFAGGVPTTAPATRTTPRACTTRRRPSPRRSPT